MVEVVTLTCPNCGGNLEVPGDWGKCYCRYCGTPILIHDGSYTITHRTIDDAKVIEAQAKASAVTERLRFEYMAKRTALVSVIVTLAVTLIAGIIAATTGNARAENLAYTILCLLMMSGLVVGVIYKNHIQGKQDRVMANKGCLPFPLSFISAKKMNVEDVVAVLTEAGFENVETIGLHDVTLLTSMVNKEGRVVEMTVDGERLSKGDWIPHNASIHISYHSK